MPVATCIMNYEPIVTVNQEVANAPAPDGLTLDEKVEFVQVRQVHEGAGRVGKVIPPPVVGKDLGCFFFPNYFRARFPNFFIFGRK